MRCPGRAGRSWSAEDRRAPRWLWVVPVLTVLPGLGSLLGGAGPAVDAASPFVALGLARWPALRTALLGVVVLLRREGRPAERVSTLPDVTLQP